MTTYEIPPVDPAGSWDVQLVALLAIVTVLMAWILWDALSPLLKGDDE